MEMKISDELNVIVKYSKDEAMRTGNYGIGADHLFLGMLRHLDNDACRTLKALGADISEAKEFIDSKVFRKETIPYSDIDSIVFTRAAQSILNLSILEATRLGHARTGCVHLLLAISRSVGNNSQAFLKSKGISYENLLRTMQEEHFLDFPRLAGDEAEPDEDPREQDSPAATEQEFKVEDFGFDLTAAAADGLLDPVVGREEEIERVIEILGRRKKNNPMLIGEAGVGKSAIVEALAQRIASGTVPAVLKDKRLISLDIASVVAGTRYRGDFEKRFKQIIEGMKKDRSIILFIDEFHTIVGAGGAQGSLDAANMLKPALARGEIRCIGATTVKEFTKIVEKDAALDRRFQKVGVEATDAPRTISILDKLKQKYESFHNVRYTVEALDACVRLTDRYVSDRALPDKAIDAMDEAGSMVRLSIADEQVCGTVTEEDVAKVISGMTGIPVSKVARTEGQRLLSMKAWLQQKVVGQDEAIDTIVRAIRRNRAGLKEPGRPVGSFLFFGPTGVGKTRLAKCLAEYLFDSEENLIRIDMSEYTEKISSSRLIGAPPGYVGYEEGGQLSEKVRRKPYSVVLLDEIEKAHPDIFNLLLQVLDDGRLTDSNGRTVSFRNTIVIMTSNVGTREVAEYGSGVGFARAEKDIDASRKSVLEKAVRKVFPPEFINRVDEKVHFNTLDRDDMDRIVSIELKELLGRAEAEGYRLDVSAAVRKAVAEEGYDTEFGARPLKRALMKYIEDPVSEFIIADRMQNGQMGTGKTAVLKVGMSGGKPKVTKRNGYQ